MSTVRIRPRVSEPAGGRARGVLAPAPAPAAPGPERDLLEEFFWREDELAADLDDLVAAAPSRPVADAPEARREWLTFTLGGEEYGAAIEQVREVLKAPAITEVPRAPADVLGVIMVRGEVIAVIDPRRGLGLPAAPPGPKARVVVCDAGGGPRGILVDAVSDVVRLAPSAIEPRPTSLGGTSAEHITGIGRDAGRLIILLDLVALLHDEVGAA